MKEIIIDNNVYIIDVIIKPRNRRIYLRVKNGVLVFTSPYKLNDSFIKNMIIKSKHYIDKALLKKEEIVENSIHFLGFKYNFNTIISNENKCLINDDEFVIYTKKNDDKYIKKIINTFYNNELKRIVDENIFEIKRKFHIDFPIEFCYKDVKSYFGECIPKRKKVILATKLAKYDINYILSVIYHELAHFFYMNHSNQFYNLLEMLYPNYRKVQKNLRMIKYHDIY